MTPQEPDPLAEMEARKDAAYFERRSLRRHAGAGSLWALGVGASLQSQLFAVPAFDPITIAAVAAIVVVVTAIACYAPARRATRVDPIVALRES